MTMASTQPTSSSAARVSVPYRTRAGEWCNTTHRALETTISTARSAPSRSRDHFRRSSSRADSSDTTSTTCPTIDSSQNWRTGEANAVAGPNAWWVWIIRQLATDARAERPSPARWWRWTALAAVDAEQHGHGQHDQGGTDDAADPAGPERPQPDAVAVGPAGEQAGHGQEAQEHEQRVRAEVAALGPAGCRGRRRRWPRRRRPSGRRARGSGGSGSVTWPGRSPVPGRLLPPSQVAAHHLLSDLALGDGR